MAKRFKNVVTLSLGKVIDDTDAANTLYTLGVFGQDVQLTHIYAVVSEVIVQGTTKWNLSVGTVASPAAYVAAVDMPATTVNTAIDMTLVSTDVTAGTVVIAKQLVAGATGSPTGKVTFVLEGVMKV